MFRVMSKYKFNQLKTTLTIIFLEKLIKAESHHYFRYTAWCKIKNWLLRVKNNVCMLLPVTRWPILTHIMLL